MFRIARAALLAAACACAAVWAASAATATFIDDFEAEIDTRDGVLAKWSVAEGSADVMGRSAETPSFGGGTFSGSVDFAEVVWKVREDGLRQFVTFSTAAIAPEEQAASLFGAFGGDRNDSIINDARLPEPIALRLARSAPAAASLAAAPASGSLLFLTSALIGLFALKRKR